MRRTSRHSGPQYLRRLSRPQTKRIDAPEFPALSGAPVHILFDELYSHYAASNLRKRQIVFDYGLKRDRAEFRRILVHELFHFAWQRLGNGARNAWKTLLASEFSRGARGELGWSSELRKDQLLKGRIRTGKHWAEYACESFCDTAAWLYTGQGAHPEFTLDPPFRRIRAKWLCRYLGSGVLRI